MQRTFSNRLCCQLPHTVTAAESMDDCFLSMRDQWYVLDAKEKEDARVTVADLLFAMSVDDGC